MFRTVVNKINIKNEDENVSVLLNRHKYNNTPSIVLF